MTDFFVFLSSALDHSLSAAHEEHGMADPLFQMLTPPLHQMTTTCFVSPHCGLTLPGHCALYTFSHCLPTDRMMESLTSQILPILISFHLGGKEI